jgi:hypothetical protein
MKWIEQQERILQTHECYSREPMESILCYFVYVNLENSIEKVTSERIDLSGGGSKTVISSEQVLQLIQSNRISTPTTKYIFQESFLYYVDLESENLQQFIQGDNYVDISKRFLQVLPLLDDIVVPPSIFVFHHLNSLYFLFKEVVNKQTAAPKSILKGSGSGTRKRGGGQAMNLENIVFNNMFSSFHSETGEKGQSGEPTKTKRVTMKLVPRPLSVPGYTGGKGDDRAGGRGRGTRRILEN